MPTRKARGIVTRPGFLRGKGASARPRTLTWIVGERKMRRSADTVPTIMLACAPRVVNGRQKMESTSAGKLALAAMAKARPTM